MSSTKKILIIDDEPEIGEIIMDILTPHFPNCRFISDSKLALKNLETNKYSMIISDVTMPGLYGPDLIRHLRAIGCWTLVIFVTGHCNKETALTALRLGVEDLIEKPFEPDSLVQTVRRIFEIDKRRTQLILENYEKNLEDPETLKKAKMLGLLHLANESKKSRIE
jgi:DNA-binding NtrC family response regulator